VLASESDRLVIPAIAVTTGQQGTYVYVMNADSTASPRNVDVARTQGDFAVVANGLEPGETVVTDGQFRLSPGSKVLVRKPGGAGGGASKGVAPGGGDGTPARGARATDRGTNGGRGAGNPS
jgi:multidrug efflux system membrane fusion protein